jgi:hypothetical protein
MDSLAKHPHKKGRMDLVNWLAVSCMPANEFFTWSFCLEADIMKNPDMTIYCFPKVHFAFQVSHVFLFVCLFVLSQTLVCSQLLFVCVLVGTLTNT